MSSNQNRHPQRKSPPMTSNQPHFDYGPNQGFTFMPLPSFNHNMNNSNNGEQAPFNPYLLRKNGAPFAMPEPKFSTPSPLPMSSNLSAPTSNYKFPTVSNAPNAYNLTPPPLPTRRTHTQPLPLPIQENLPHPQSQPQSRPISPSQGNEVASKFNNLSINTQNLNDQSQLDPLSQESRLGPPRSKYKFSEVNIKQPNYNQKINTPVSNEPEFSLKRPSSPKSEVDPVSLMEVLEEAAPLALVEEVEDISLFKSFEKIDPSFSSHRGHTLYYFIKREVNLHKSLVAIDKILTKRIQETKIFDEESSVETTEMLLLNIPDMIPGHRRLCEGLLSRALPELEPPFDTVRLGDLLLAFISEFDALIKFTSNLEASLEYINSAQLNSLKFRLWLQNAEKHKFFKGLKLVDFLTAIPYHLDPQAKYLKEFVSLTDKSSNDYPLLEMALHSLQAVADEIEALRESKGSNGPPSEDPLQLSRSSSQNSNPMEGPVHSNIDFEGMSFAMAVPKQLVESLTSDEVKRQEAIYELCRTEREYLSDLDVVQTVFIEGIRGSDCYISDKADFVVNKMFSGATDIFQLHQPLAAKLTMRQKQQVTVDQVGDLLLEWAQNLTPYNFYCARIEFALGFYRKEKIENPKFSGLIDRLEADPRCKRLNMASFISMPTRRLQKYPLLVKDMMKRLVPGHPDVVKLESVQKHLQLQLELLDKTKGEHDSQLRLRSISDRIIDPYEYFLQYPRCHLELDNKGRRLIKEGSLKLIRNSAMAHVFLFDNYLVFCKEIQIAEDICEYEVSKRPMKLSDLSVHDTVNQSFVYADASLFNSLFTPNNTVDNFDHCFRVFSYDSREGHILMAPSKFEKEAWVTALNGVLYRT